MASTAARPSFFDVPAMSAALEAAVSAAEPRPQRGRPYDAGKRRKATRRRHERGISVYIPAEVLIEAGFPLDATAYYRTAGYQRSANGHTVIVSLYREP
jgi:hypothetical protein